MANLKHALYYAELGIPVLPCCWPDTEGKCACGRGHSEKEVGKAPLTERGVWNATTDQRAIEKWWGQWPDANIGGALDGIVAIDPDSPEAKDEAFKRGLPPDSWQSDHHYFYRCPEHVVGHRVTKVDDSRSLDILASGYVILPESVHRSGDRYRWVQSPHDHGLEEAPEWAVLELEKQIVERAKAADLPDDLPQVDVDQLRVSADVRKIILEGMAAFPERYPSESEALFAVEAALMKEGYPDSVVASVVTNSEYAINEKPLRMGRKWLTEELGRVREKVGPVRSALPAVNIGNRQLRDKSAAATKALAAQNDPPRIYERGGALVRLVRRGQGLPEAEVLTRVTLQAELAQTANWVVTDQHGNDRPVDPPNKVIENVLGQADWSNIPHLESIIFGPAMVRGPEILHQPGYHRASGLLHVGEALRLPTLEGVEQAVEILDDVFCDFPFVDEASRANTYGLLVSLVVRPGIPDSFPMFLVDSPVAGTGKGLLVDAASAIVLGYRAWMMSPPRDKDEWRKRITSAVMKSRPIVVIDNLKTRLRSEALATLLTRETWEDRLLGVNKEISAPNKTVWCVTANNPDFDEEMSRRAVRIRLVSDRERPWEGRTFRHPELMLWIKRSRAKLLSAVVTLVQAWIDARGPSFSGELIGGYERWTKIVGGVLQNAGVKGFLGNREELYAMLDPEREEWAAFVREWAGAFGERSVRANELYDKVVLPTEGLLSDALSQGKDDRAKRVILGRQLRKQLGRTYGEWTVMPAVGDAGAGVKKYKLRRAS